MNNPLVSELAILRRSGAEGSVPLPRGFGGLASAGRFPFFQPEHQCRAAAGVKFGATLVRGEVQGTVLSILERADWGHISKCSRGRRGSRNWRRNIFFANGRIIFVLKSISYRRGIDQKSTMASSFLEEASLGRSMASRVARQHNQQCSRELFLDDGSR